MKQLIFGSLMIFMMSMFLNNVFAQQPSATKTDRLKSELNLSDQQASKIEKIFQSKHEKMKSMRSAEYNSPEEKHTAMRNLRQSFNKEIENVLDKDQLAKYQEMKKDRKGKYGKHGKGAHFKHRGDGKGKEFRTQIRAYKDEHIKPVMLKQRTKLESKISKADKKTIAQLRADHDKKRADNTDKKARFEEMKKSKSQGKYDGHKKHKGRKAGSFNEENREKLKGLVEKYESDIQLLFDEIAPQQEKWKKDIREIANSTLEMEGKELDKKRGFHGDKMKMMKMSRFLLLDPNEKPKPAIAQNLVTKVNVFPNPATDAATIEYEVVEAGEVLIELRDNKGNLLETLKKSFHEKGAHRLPVSLENYQGERFHIVIQDKNGSSTTKNIVRVK